MELLNQLLFVFSNGDKITDVSIDTYVRIRTFIEELAAQYSDSAFAADANPSAVLADTFAPRFSEVEKRCELYAQSQPGVQGIIGARGKFADLIQLILDNQEALLNLINLIIKFTGGASDQTSVQSSEPDQLPPATA